MSSGWITPLEQKPPVIPNAEQRTQLPDQQVPTGKLVRSSLLHYLADEVNVIRSPNNVLVILDTYNQYVFVF